MVLGLLVASPSVIAWLRRDAGPPPAETAAPAVTLRLPVEVIFPGESPEWRQVVVPVTAVPEPSALPLALLTGLLLLRRKR